MDATSTTYGSDEAGLICGFQCRRGSTIPIESAEAARWLADLRRPGAEPDGFLWLHFSLAHNAARH
jgi:zinc transporter